MSWPAPSGGTREGGSWGSAGPGAALDMVSGQYTPPTALKANKRPRVAAPHGGRGA